MKFKKLSVSGFKSFADKLEIKFGAGITAIVGPNGCGKSNVADSIRWVLGEQSAKLLRGSTMQDVIFNGTEHRKSLSFCEVNLHFDNTNKQLFPTLDFNEVVISRRLYRSGESEYLLNKSVCRLKDIVDVLRDASMGREGYSIIGQGRIDEVLSSKPENRREIFEEAAGITKFKARKKEAERKLERTNEQLTRIIDILNEKAKQLEPLSKQAENARKWLDLRDKLKGLEINTYIYQYDTANQAKEVISSRLNGVLEHIDLKQKESDEVMAAFTEAMNEFNNADKSIEALREELMELSVGNEKIKGEMKLLNERAGYLNMQNERLAFENENLDRDYISLAKFIENGLTELDKCKNEFDKKRIEAEKYSDDYLKIMETLTQGEGEVAEHHRSLVEAMDKLTEIKSNMSRLLAEREGLEKSCEGLKARIAFNNDKLLVDTAEEKNQRDAIAELGETHAELEKQRDSTMTIHNEAVHTVSESARKLDKLNEKFYTLKTRRKMLKEMQEAYEGFAYSVKKLLSDAKENKNLAKRMEGVVAQLIKVEPKFETAIELALGNAVQNVVTSNEEDAKFLIEYLKKHRYGRVTFLPITSIKPRSIDSIYHKFLNFEGCYGAADKLISFDPKYEVIIRGLLGSTVVVKDMDLAVELAKKTGYAFKIVTLDGDIINPHGAITGGSKKSELTNIFSYEREINLLDTQIADIESEILDLTQLRDQKHKTGEETLNKVRDLRNQIHSIEVVLATKNETRSKLTASNEELVISIGNLEFELLNNNERIVVINSDLDSVAELENLVTGKKADAAVGGQERQQQFEALKAERNKLHELMTASKIEATNLENAVHNYENEIKRLQENSVITAEKIESNNSQIAENKKLIETINSELNNLIAGEGEFDNGRSSQIRDMLGSLDERKQLNKAKVDEFEERRNCLVNEIQALYEKKNKEEMLLLKVDTDIELMQQRILEEYNLEYSDCLQFRQEGYDVNSGVAESARIKRQMSALGNINIDSIEQCKSVFESYNQLSEQKDDLVKAKTDIEKIISELSCEMLTRFTESFEKIRENFKKVFKELFDGGTADLILHESENMLEAGIEIVAQPPEKKLQSIMLLSGGERALTAIAILFAILKLRPMPFCVLDEIEAALDDANAARFAKYLRRFSEGTQFIVITHRKPTMELADNLYGVTMEEKGVSKIVSVKLSEAVAVADKAVQ